MEPKKIIIPNGRRFADLELEREPLTRRLLYKPGPLARLLSANELDLQALFNDDDIVCWLVAEFYLAHRSAGGEPDAVAEEILVEVAGQHAGNIPAIDPGGGREH